MRSILASFLLVLLTACGGSGPGKLAADACVAEANQRLAGKTFDLDTASLMASAKPEEGTVNIWRLSSNVVFDRGLSSEFTQNVICRARVDDGLADVLLLQFLWSNEDLKFDGASGE